MLKLVINIEGKETHDLLYALEEAKRVIEESQCVSGSDDNEDGSYDFHITGEEE